MNDQQPHRYIEKRSQFLARATELSKMEGKALACAEMGYTTSGTAELIESSEGTVKKYREVIIALFGPDVLNAKDERQVDDEPKQIGLDYLSGATNWMVETWKECVRKHPERVDETVADYICD